MKNKKKFIGLVIILILIIIFIGYKTYLLSKFKPSLIEFENYFDNISEIEIKTNKSLQTNKVENMVFYQPLELKVNHKLDENLENKDIQKALSKVKEDENNPDTIMYIGKSTSSIVSLSEDELLKSVDCNKLKEKYDIKDSIDILKYYIDHRKDKRNIFWSSSRIKMIYLAANYVKSLDNITTNNSFVVGELKGFMTKSDDNSFYHIVFTYHNEDYFVTLIDRNKNYFTEELVTEILESIYFEDVM